VVYLRLKENEPLLKICGAGRIKEKKDMLMNYVGKCS
jgi:hypothetical protein